MHPQDGELRDREAYSMNGQEGHQERGHEQIFGGRRSMLEVCSAMDDIGNGQEARLCGNASESVADRELGVPSRRRNDRGGDAREGGRCADEQRSHHRLTHSGVVGEIAGGPGHPNADKANHTRNAYERDDH
jgi:hypothetical protein